MLVQGAICGGSALCSFVHVRTRKPKQQTLHWNNDDGVECLREVIHMTAVLLAIVGIITNIIGEFITFLICHITSVLLPIVGIITNVIGVFITFM